jgi:sarcosine oxidase subunit beta
MRTTDVVVIGAGITGLSAAYRLARAGAKVIVLDKGRTAYEASSRATGYLSLRGDCPPEVPLAMVAEKVWGTLDEELGYPTEWTPKGRLWAACNEAEWRDIRETYEQFSKTPVGFELIDGKRCRELVPQMTDDVIGGIHTPRSGHANAQRTSQAYAWAFRDRGGEILENCPVLKVATTAGRVIGVETVHGPVHAGVVVSCAGPQNALIAAQFGVEFPIAAARFEALVTAPLSPLYQVALIAHQLSVRQTGRGNLHVSGGPHEWVHTHLMGEVPKPNTPIVRGMARRVVELLPAIGNTAVVRCWSGVTEVTPDQMCIFERFESPEGLVMASTAGHGFGMSAAAGLVLSDLALHGRTELPAANLSLRRFAGLPTDWRERIHWNPGSYNT